MWKELAKHAGGVVLAWVVVLVGTFFLLRLYSQPSAQRQVPDLSGMARMNAFDTLATLGLEGVWQDSIYLPTGTPGGVVEQHPPAGSAVKVGRKILLTTHRITPPDEAVSYQEGQDAKLVERILTTRGFRISVEEEPNQLLVGKVIRLEHKGKVLDSETRLPKGSDLILVAGVLGSDEARVPWLSGLSLQDAASVLARRKLALGHVGYAPDVLTAQDSANAVVASRTLCLRKPLMWRKAPRSICILTFDDFHAHDFHSPAFSKAMNKLLLCLGMLCGCVGMTHAQRRSRG